MIRPLPYVDMPGIVFALDRRMRALGRPFANFVCAPEFEETRSGLPAALHNLLPLRATAQTWISEEHWRLIGVAQARPRPRSGSWDLVYLASLAGVEPEASDILRQLIETATNAAMLNGMQRIFARTAENDAALLLFHKVGFQRYARELLYVREHPVLGAGELPEAEHGLGMVPPRPHRWHPRDGWALARLHDATTPRKVQFAENLATDELIGQLVDARRWHVPLLEPRDESYVLWADRSAGLAGWVRLRQSWAGQPHQIWLKALPDQPATADLLLRFALERLCERDVHPGGRHSAMPVICHVRDYEGLVIDSLRRAGFTHAGTKAILARHLTLSAVNERLALGLGEARVIYGVKGLGTVQPFALPHSLRDETVCHSRSPMTSTLCSPRSRRASAPLWKRTLSVRRLSRSSWTWGDRPRPASPPGR